MTGEEKANKRRDVSNDSLELKVRHDQTFMHTNPHLSKAGSN